MASRPARLTTGATFASIAPGSVPAFIASQLVGGTVRRGAVRILYPQARKHNVDLVRMELARNHAGSPGGGPTDAWLQEIMHGPKAAISGPIPEVMFPQEPRDSGASFRESTMPESRYTAEETTVPGSPQPP